MVSEEIAANPDPVRRARVQRLAGLCFEWRNASAADLHRAEELEELGFRGLDALHLACAESLSADVFLTTDDALLRRAVRHAAVLRVAVANPVAWLLEESVR